MTTIDEPLADDLLASDVNRDPHPYFRALREHDPVHWSGVHKAWLVTRYDDVSAGLVDFKRLSSDRVGPVLDRMDAQQRDEAGAVMDLISGWMVVTDPPAHRRLRRLASKAFNPRRVAAKEPRITELIDELLDAFVAEGHEDLIAEFTYPLPATVIAELIGAPEEDTHLFRGWSNALAHVAFGAGGDDRDDRHAVATQGLQEMLAYFDERLEHVRRHPGEDMISDLLAGDEKGEALSDEEIKAMCALMLFAGHETTTSTIASGVVSLLEHPEQLERLRRDPELGGGAAEESLRYEGAIKVLIRVALEDLEIRGREIKAGDRLFLLPAAANRDPEKFEDPEGFDIARTPNPHVAFGKGVHACIGAQLARIEMRVALAKIAERLPGLRLADDPSELAWVPSLASRGLSTLAVRHDATSR